jgi:peptide/nickel transport system ATP-binding protein
VTDEPILELDHARISYFTRAGEVNVIPGLSFALGAGEAMGLVGESGCGKSTVALAIVRYLGRAGRITRGRILFEGRDVAGLSPSELREMRGRRVAMVYQDPMASLNPVMTVGRQLMEVPMLHEGLGERAARARALDMLAEVQLLDGESMLARYPHQLSGGQQQRIVIAMALIAEPALLIMDEPTTGLDVTVEAAVLDLVRELRRRHGTSVLFISHNLGTVVRVCDRIGVMYAGELVEAGSIRQVFANPRHPYTRGLLDCLPTLGRDKRQTPLVPIPGQVASALVRPAGCGFAARCVHVEPGRCTSEAIPALPVTGDPGHAAQCVRAAELPPWERRRAVADAALDRRSGPIALRVEGLEKLYRPRPGLFGSGRAPVRALNGIDLVVRKGETLAIVGESGCGKSTLAKVLTGLETASAGRVEIGGREVASMRVESRPLELRRTIQMVFQNPDSTLNPSHSAGYAIGRALRRLRRTPKGEAAREASRLLGVVKLPTDLGDRKPDRLSGGQKQRVAIARALAGNPDVIVADEPVSALDVSVQASIINLLNEIQASREATLVFISHDLSVVRYLADHVAVMYLGAVVEVGSVADVFAPPFHPYTEALLSAVPVPDPDAQGIRIILEGPLPSATDIPSGCPFSGRCPRRIGAICDDTPPPTREISSGHRIVCHIPAEELTRLQSAPPSSPSPTR